MSNALPIPKSDFVPPAIFSLRIGILTARCPVGVPTFHPEFAMILQPCFPPLLRPNAVAISQTGAFSFLFAPMSQSSDNEAEQRKNASGASVRSAIATSVADALTGAAGGDHFQGRRSHLHES